MGKTDEYLRLPHGMFDREADWVRRERYILGKHDEIGRTFGSDVKKYTPLGYSETYQRGTNAANEKVYKFNSKTGKSLMLSSDSTPSIFREYLASGESKGKRISFVAPLFRYRNSHSRHFTQIGYAIINELRDNNMDVDTRIVELGNGMVELFQSMGIKPKVMLNNYEALKSILSHDISEDEMHEVLYKLQFFSEEERIDYIQNNISDPDRKQILIDLFKRKPTEITDFDETKNILGLPPEYLGIYKLAEALKEHSRVSIYFDPSNLHSIETIDNYALRFITEGGTHLGDGGEYTSYAKRFDDRINSFWSVASGVEAIERNSPLKLQLEQLKKVALFNTDASGLFTIQTIKILEDNGYAVVYQGCSNKIGKAIKKLDSDYTHVSIIGKNEEETKTVSIRDLESRIETPITINPQIAESTKLDNQSSNSQESSNTIKDIISVMREYFRTSNFNRERLIELIANHSKLQTDTYLSAEDIETLILEVGRIYEEKGIIKDNRTDKTIES